MSDARGPLLRAAPADSSTRRGTIATGGPARALLARMSPAELLVLSACFLVGLGLVIHDLAQPAGLYGVTEYDDGVYFASGLRLAEGFLPYKDFVLLQPPGMALLMAPFGLLAHLLGARDALAGARLLTGVVAGANALLVAALLRHRGLFAAAVGGMLMAVFPPAWTADHTLMLEPWLVLCCLIGTALCFSAGQVASLRRVLLGGAFFGIAGTVKAWAIVPVLVLLVVLAIRHRAEAGAFAIGVGGAFVLICLPFFAFAPHGFVTDVITSQLARGTVAPTALNVRLSAYTGLAFASPGLLTPPFFSKATWPDIAAVLLGLTLVVGSALPLLRRKGDALEAFLLLAAAGAVATTFVPQQFFTHYAYFTAPFLAAGVGFAAGRAAALAGRALHRRAAGPPKPSAALVAAGGLLVAVGLVLVLPGELSADRVRMGIEGDPGPAIAAAIPKGACVLTDAISITISADRADATAPGCPPLIDATGTWISYDPSNPPQRSDTAPPPAALVQAWRGYLSRSQYVLLSGACATRVPFTAGLLAYFEQHYELLHVPGPAIYRRLATTLPVALRTNPLAHCNQPSRRALGR